MLVIRTSTSYQFASELNQYLTTLFLYLQKNNPTHSAWGWNLILNLCDSGNVT